MREFVAGSAVTEMLSPRFTAVGPELEEPDRFDELFRELEEDPNPEDPPERELLRLRPRPLSESESEFPSVRPEEFRFDVAVDPDDELPSPTRPASTCANSSAFAC
jgi:hypothetical protein